MYLTEEQNKELYTLYQKKVVPLGEFELKAYNHLKYINKKNVSNDVDIYEDKFSFTTRNEDILISVVIGVDNEHRLSIYVYNINGMAITNITTNDMIDTKHCKLRFVVNTVVNYDGYIYNLIKSCILYTTDKIHKCIASQIDVDNIKSLISSLDNQGDD